MTHLKWDRLRRRNDAGWANERQLKPKPPTPFRRRVAGSRPPSRQDARPVNKALKLVSHFLRSDRLTRRKRLPQVDDRLEQLERDEVERLHSTRRSEEIEDARRTFTQMRRVTLAALPSSTGEQELRRKRAAKATAKSQENAERKSKSEAKHRTRRVERARQGQDRRRQATEFVLAELERNRCALDAFTDADRQSVEVSLSTKMWNEHERAFAGLAILDRPLLRELRSVYEELRAVEHGQRPDPNLASRVKTLQRVLRKQ